MESCQYEPDHPPSDGLGPFGELVFYFFHFILEMADSQSSVGNRVVSLAQAT